MDHDDARNLAKNDKPILRGRAFIDRAVAIRDGLAVSPEDLREFGAAVAQLDELGIYVAQRIMVHHGDCRNIEYIDGQVWCDDHKMVIAEWRK